MAIQIHKQAYTSANTSVNSKKLPRLVTHINWEWLKDKIVLDSLLYREPMSIPIVLDYGCGREYAHIQEYIQSFGWLYVPYDKYNLSKKENEIAFRVNPHVIICSNVLNVIKENEVVNQLHDFFYDWSENNYHYWSGPCYFISVYEGDKSMIGRETKPDCWQRNSIVENYIRYNTEGIKNKIIAPHDMLKYII